MMAVWLESWAGYLVRRLATLLIGPCCVERLCGRVALPGAPRCHRHEGELALATVVHGAAYRDGEKIADVEVKFRGA